jgi:hypothetical protein
MRRAFRRVPVPPPQQQQGVLATFPAPIRGKISNENLAGAQPLGAKVLVNAFPTQTGVRIRGGSKLIATVTNGAACLSMFTYVSGGLHKHFAATADKVFDVSAVADPAVIPAEEFSGQTTGYYSFAQFATSGGSFLYIVNGADKPMLYSGTAWTAIDGASTPAITGVTTATLSHVWVYRKRLFFVQTGTLNAWALPVDSIGGAATQISLAGIFQNGGSLLTGATWSLDAGDGIDDRCVFISDNGEVAVYEGADPSDASNWNLVGRYDISPLLGKRAMLPIAGDVLLLTQDGIVPLSQVVTKDPAALSLAAVSRNIEPDWRSEVSARNSHPWEMVKFPNFSMGIVSLPKTTSTEPKCFVVNLETGAWGEYSGWDTQCLIIHAGWAYFGTSDGKVMQAEIGGNDNGRIYTAQVAGQFDHLRNPGITKTVRMIRETWRSSRDFISQLSLSVNYQTQWPVAPNSAPDTTALDLWDVGLWDQAKWDAAQAERQTIVRWRSGGKTGFTISYQVQVTCGVTASPDAELVSLDLLYENGQLSIG